MKHEAALHAAQAFLAWGDTKSTARIELGSSWLEEKCLARYGDFSPSVTPARLAALTYVMLTSTISPQ
jgi:hypothetical protein